MYLINAISEPIPVGIQGEANVTVIDFDISAWVTLYGSGTVSATYQNPKGKLNLLPSNEIVRETVVETVDDVTTTSYIVHLHITKNITAQEGTGSIVFKYVAGTYEKHTKAYLVVEQGHDVTGAMPEVLVDWVNAANELIEAAAPVVLTAAPLIDAAFIGQISINTLSETAYIAVNTGSGASDWKVIT